MIDSMLASIMIEQLREVEMGRILSNPVTIRLNYRETKDNGFGVLIPDLSKALYYVESYPFMIAPEQTPVLKVAGSESPFGIANQSILMIPYDNTWLKENMVFDANQRRYKILSINTNVVMGGVISKMARLQDVTETIDVSSDLAVIGDAGVLFDGSDAFVIGEA